MKYHITKECGVGWDQPFESAVSAWGVSQNQYRLARKVEPGDILLHYIDGVHAWAGYSTVTGTLRDNNRDSHADWLAALPYVIPIEQGVWLSKSQCECAIQVAGLSHNHFNRQVAFTAVRKNDAIRIIEAIRTAEAVDRTLPASAAFHKRWMIGAETYYKGIVKGLTGGACWLCGNDAKSWSAKLNISLSEVELEVIRDTFLDGAHIVANCDSGPMTPDNLRGLCPNCHRLVDRLPSDVREKLLRSKQSTSREENEKAAENTDPDR